MYMSGATRLRTEQDGHKFSIKPWAWMVCCANIYMWRYRYKVIQKSVYRFTGKKESIAWGGSLQNNSFRGLQILRLGPVLCWSDPAIQQKQYFRGAGIWNFSSIISYTLLYFVCCHFSIYNDYYLLYYPF